MFFIALLALAAAAKYHKAANTWFSEVPADRVPQLSFDDYCRVGAHNMMYQGHYLPAVSHHRKFGYCSAEAFEVGKFLGRGAYGIVRLGRHIATGERVAIKFVRKSANEQRRFRKIRNEECNMHRMQHPLIVKHYCTFIAGEEVAMVMELIKGEALVKIVRKPDEAEIRLRERDRPFIIAQLVVVLQYLHEQGIVFNDMRTKNTMILPNKRIKLIDFGLSVHTKASPYADLSQPALPPLIRSKEDGEVDWEAMQQNLALDLQPKSIVDDWWHLGTLMYEMYTGIKPSWANPTQKHYVKYSLGMDCPKEMPKRACELFQRLTDPQVDKRWGPTWNSLTLLKQHSYFEGIDWSRLDK